MIVSHQAFDDLSRIAGVNKPVQVETITALSSVRRHRHRFVIAMPKDHGRIDGTCT